ncbi:hypothetical protein F7725_021247 [Dissostichus mawsoni]|uniref:Uncharacterized protein n=1 Tax=Dissostichus mawsoni TaxID=36200 RepID=A0A7J5YHH0_DISMA|nr:hypothetical protein F7725_021247 [Dissostichus mawsoni]
MGATLLFPLLWEGAAQVEVMLKTIYVILLCVICLPTDYSQSPPLLLIQKQSLATNCTFSTNSCFLPNQVTLVHPSEAITVLNRLTLFRSGSRSETTTCNICLRQTKQPICDFTDPRTGDPWFCYKPKNMSCDARIAHSSVGYKQTLKAKEDELFQGKEAKRLVICVTSYKYIQHVLPIYLLGLKFQNRVNLKVCIPASDLPVSLFYQKGRSTRGGEQHCELSASGY